MQKICTVSTVITAAGRIRTALLDGAGTSQTQLDLDKEYDFGMKQVRLAEEKSLAADLKLTGLASMLDRIQEATVALGVGTGRVPGKNRAQARSLRIREALQECSATATAASPAAPADDVTAAPAAKTTDGKDPSGSKIS